MVCILIHPSFINNRLVSWHDAAWRGYIRTKTTTKKKQHSDIVALNMMEGTTTSKQACAQYFSVSARWDWPANRLTVVVADRMWAEKVKREREVCGVIKLRSLATHLFSQTDKQTDGRVVKQELWADSLIGAVLYHYTEITNKNRRGGDELKTIYWGILTREWRVAYMLFKGFLEISCSNSWALLIILLCQIVREKRLVVQNNGSTELTCRCRKSAGVTNVSQWEPVHTKTGLAETGKVLYRIRPHESGAFWDQNC